MTGPDRSNVTKGMFTKTARCAFTLVEILLVMMITSILVLAANAAYQQVYVVWSRIVDRTPVYQKSRLIIDTLRQELACLYWPGVVKKEKVEAITIINEANGNTVTTFYTLGASWNAGSASSYMTRVQYIFSSDSGTEGNVLSRTEQNFSGNKPVSAVKTEIIMKGLARFSISDSNPKKNEENSEGGNIKPPPESLKVELSWPETKNMSEYSFQTMIPIACNSPLGGAEDDAEEE